MQDFVVDSGKEAIQCNLRIKKFITVELNTYLK